MAHLLNTMLREEGYAVDVAGLVEEGRVNALVNAYDILVLDVRLPDGNGVSLVQALRREGRDTPILVVTGDSDEELTARALDAGADDYMQKPVRVSEFKARVRALVRRGGAKRTEHLALGNVVLNRLSREVHVAGEPLVLTQRDFRLLEHFMLHAGAVVPRTTLLESVFDLSFEPDTNVVDVSVARLRKKLSAAGANLVLETRRGVGLVLRAE